MADTNYISSIVKILEKPVKKVFTNDTNDPISVIKFRVQVPQIRNTIIISLTFWGNLGEDVLNYYQINDYIIVEGYLSFRDKKVNNLTTKNLKKMEISVLRVYPFLLKSNYSFKKNN
jgi:hypothetical protein